MRALAAASLVFVPVVVLGLLPVEAQTYQYDPAGRLVSVTYDSGKKMSYSYDGAGNLTSLVVENESAGDSIPASSLAEVWVDFNHAGSELGTAVNPFDTAGEGATAVSAGGTVHLTGGGSVESLRILKPMTLTADSGPVQIGQN